LTGRSGLVKEFAAKLHTEESLSETFFYLVYCYSDKLYDDFKAATPEQKAAMQKHRPEGRRLYDPAKFQGTEEERRLDALLGYLDVIAFHYRRGVLPMRDIAGSMGFHLQAIASRKVIVEYRNTTADTWWDKSSFQKDYKSVAPFGYLDNLLNDFKNFCKDHQNEIDKLKKGRL
jgi:hypothetical protein